MRNRAIEILKENYKDDYLFDYKHGEIDIDYQEMLDYITDKMMKFATEMCELQKKECANNAILGAVGFDNNYNKQSILNCKNICDENK